MGSAHLRDIQYEGDWTSFDLVIILLGLHAFLHRSAAVVECLGVAEELNERGRQRLLIVLDRKNIVASLLDDLCGNICPAAYGA